jgi:hypothetical protein
MLFLLQKGGIKMKERFSNKLSYIGAGTGIALFAIFGLMPGAYIGGILGVNTANTLFGFDATPSLFHRLLTAMGMLTGVMVAGLMFVVGGACLGWLVGLIVDATTKTKEEPSPEMVRTDKKDGFINKEGKNG